MNDTAIAALVFALVYAGMMLGGAPGLALDRTGAALLGAIALIAFAVVPMTEAVGAIDIPTMSLLFGLMIVSAQFRLGGFYGAVARRIAAAPLSPGLLVGLLAAAAAFLSALLSNDIVCLAMAPVLVEGCRRRRFNPVPFLLALACAANIGSAATLIGNPQNMLIGQALGLSFGRYAAIAAFPSILALAAMWAVLCLLYRGAWHGPETPAHAEAPPFNPWQTAKACAVLAVLVAVFLTEAVPRDVAALTAAGLLLLSRRMHTRNMLQLVDWPLLVLFAGLFIVNHAAQATGLLQQGVGALTAAGVDPRHPAWLFGLAAGLSNLVSNVPAVMLLLPSAVHPLAGPILALASTFAGNLIVVGSIANIIVIEQAALHGVRISWREHARTGVPVTLASLAVAALWLLAVNRFLPA